ncbi:MAG: SDR family oxidoreductase [Rhodospirillaceae bacterium]|jgi:2-deoxy-D-gluconate 3-dehydrogenase|nr:SDR family oxidoreductase [Rhodospirillaceae bacterium]MBT3929497.1 SDR family oxidoreductase [Rhodospirillaceae bacterium]MBT4771816.1 SDR family oxidoreductase [Rhodospirillaceae bacterium]MBT5358667.1 SDR family oxidoreductase [Rhodospirillaceae bacterium]MBT5768712.1 SDR family oxidoreductase [Rhodospirillaceae bacterium]
MSKALVTGASTGLGREIALTLARAGYDVALADREIGLLDEVMNHPDLSGVTAIPVEIELLSEASIREGVAGAIDGLGGLDTLVNNAGRTLLQKVVDVTWDEWDSVMGINLKGGYFAAARLAEHCIGEGKAGSVINIASTHGLTGLAGRSVYGISKGGLIQMARMLAIEWAEAGIRVNVVAPGTVLTESRQKLLEDPDLRARMQARIPTGQFPQAQEIADAVLFLASAGPSLTGQVIAVDGGLTAE